MDRRHFKTLDDWARGAAGEIAEVLSADIAERGQTVLAVPGGRTAQAVLPVLKTLGLDWNRITVTLADERWVVPDHPDSNERLARELLGNKIAITGLFTGAATPEAGLDKAGLRIAALLPMGCVLLGMGEDGHIASLFPGDSMQDAPLQVTARADHPRISMTPTTLLNTRRVVVAVNGDEKCKVLERALKPGPAIDLPIRHILRQERTPVSVLTA